MSTIKDTSKPSSVLDAATPTDETPHTPAARTYSESSEIVAHLSDNQRRRFLENICEAVSKGKKPKTWGAAQIVVADVLGTFRGDQSLAIRESNLLGLIHDATRTEIAMSLAGRIGISL